MALHRHLHRADHLPRRALLGADQRHSNGHRGLRRRIDVDARHCRDSDLPHRGATAAQPRPGRLEHAVRADRLPHPDRLLPGGVARELGFSGSAGSPTPNSCGRRPTRSVWAGRPTGWSSCCSWCSPAPPGCSYGVASAAGEEIGWRGFLVPELARVLPFTGVALVSGLIWASWHYPITAVVYKDADLPPWFWLLTFTFVAVAISFAQAWLRLRSDSVWPPIFLHASHNLWMQSIFFPLTTEQGVHQVGRRRSRSGVRRRGHGRRPGVLGQAQRRSRGLWITRACLRPDLPA